MSALTPVGNSSSEPFTAYFAKCTDKVHSYYIYIQKISFSPIDSFKAKADFKFSVIVSVTVGILTIAKLAGDILYFRFTSATYDVFMLVTVRFFHEQAKNLNTFAQENETLQKSNTEFETNNKTLTQRVTTLSSQVNTLSSENSQFKSHNDTLKNTVIELKKIQINGGKTLGKLAGEIQHLKGVKQGLQHSVTKLETKIHEFGNQNKNLTQIAQDLGQNVRRLSSVSLDLDSNETPLTPKTRNGQMEGSPRNQTV